jgi:hypothetical protein
MSELKTAGSNIGGPAFGNGIAYFLLWYGANRYGYTFEDPELALAMGGAVIATLLLYINRFFRSVGNGVKYIFNRMFPEKKE